MPHFLQYLALSGFSGLHSVLGHYIIVIVLFYKSVCIETKL